MITATAIADVLEAVRAQRPLIHSITNPVVMNLTANALLAIGAAPTMAWAIEEVADVTARSQALVINLGTPTAATLAACHAAAAQAGASSLPWVLDPVGIGKAAVAKPKLSLGGIRGGAIRIGDPLDTVAICEGLEDGLTLAQELGQPTWAAAGTSNLAALVLPPSVRKLIIGADNDAPGRKAAQARQINN